MNQEDFNNLVEYVSDVVFQCRIIVLNRQRTRKDWVDFRNMCLELKRKYDKVMQEPPKDNDLLVRFMSLTKRYIDRTLRLSRLDTRTDRRNTLEWDAIISYNDLMDKIGKEVLNELQQNNT